jgi:hypothetical protein
MSYSNRIFIYGPVGLLLLVVVLYSVYWRVQADTLSARLDRANGGEIIPGLVFAFAEKSVGGFPFRLDVVLSGVSFAHRSAEGETGWRTDKLALHTLSYGRDRYIFEVTGLQSFVRPPGEPGKPPRAIFLTPAIARASAILRGGRLARFDLDLQALQAKDATEDADPQRTISADRAQLHLLSRADNTVDVAMRIDNVRIGGGYASPPSGIFLPLIDLRGKLTHGEILNGLQAGEASIPDAVQAWRTQMGNLAVSDLALKWPDALADLKGDLSLDDNDELIGMLGGMGTGKDHSSEQYQLSFADGGMRFSAIPAAPIR